MYVHVQTNETLTRSCPILITPLADDVIERANERTNEQMTGRTQKIICTYIQTTTNDKWVACPYCVPGLHNVSIRIKSCAIKTVFLVFLTKPPAGTVFPDV